MKIFLFIIFFNVEGDRILEDGWHPIEQNSYAECEEAAIRVNEYLHEMVNDHTYAACFTYEEFIRLYFSDAN